MRLGVVQESNPRRSPNPGGGLSREEGADDCQHPRAGQTGGRFPQRHLKQTGAPAFLAGFTGFAMIGGAAHVKAAVLIHSIHHGHARRLHRARFCR